MQTISKSIALKVLLSTFLIAGLIIYFMAFFSTGVYYEGAFLKKEVGMNEHYYRGQNKYGNITVTVKGQINKDMSAQVSYAYPYSINRQYTVNFKEANNWNLGIENIQDSNGNILFEGEYKKDDNYLYDRTGKPLLEDNLRTIIGNKFPHQDYQLSLKNVADFAMGSNDVIRGQYPSLILAMLLFFYTLIDIKDPLFFFQLKYSRNVNNPEPSDFYEVMQKISWCINPILILYFMIASLMNWWPN
jgi:hypothetical protein